MKDYTHHLPFPSCRLCPVIVCLVLCWLQPQAQQSSSPTHKMTFTEGDVFGSAAFLENKNIIPDYKGQKILYYCYQDNIKAFFTERGIVYEVQKAVKNTGAGKKEDKGKDKEEEEREKQALLIKTSLVRMEWQGANPHPQIITGEQQASYHTYLKKEGKSYKTLITGGYKTITYKNLYPGIDVEYTLPDKGGMEYNLLVQTGADVHAVKMCYKGRLEGLHQDADGNLIIHTKTGDILEHAPVSWAGYGWDDNRNAVSSGFSVQGNNVEFNFPNGYDAGRPLVIDPWVQVLTSLPPVNVGFTSDYDYLGNLFVYGAGPTTCSDFSAYFEVAKYSLTGNLLWTFNGSVPSVSWQTADLTSNYNFPGGFIVDKVTGKQYLGQGYCSGGATAIRLTSAGVYDNFISTVNSAFTECWGFAYNCATSAVLAIGGGVSSNNNMGVINTSTGAVSIANIDGGIVGAGQDILAAAYDTSGSLYVLMNNAAGELPYPNTMYKVNSTYNGNIWTANTGYTPFMELMNAPFWGFGGTSNYSTNWNNCLAANGSYLYYYDGFNVAAYSLATGAPVGTATTIAGYTPKYQDGIAVDNCNHIYIGGVGKIKTFTFTGSVFTPGPDILLGGAFANDTVHDVRYNSTNNLLYVTGAGFIGTYIATLSTTCVVASQFTVATSHTCTSATVTVTPSAGLNPLVFSYFWTDTAGTVISQALNSASTSNTLTGVGNGTYYAQVQWNANCGGATVLDTVVINCNTNTLTTSPDTTICPGQTVVLKATPSSTGGTFSWSPGGATTDSITVSPATTTTYTVTYTPTTGPVLTGTITVTVSSTAVSVTVNNAGICPGGTATLIATPSIPGGTYSWTPGGFTTDTISVSPTANTPYTVVYTSPACGTATGTGTVTIAPAPTVTVNSATICPGGTAVLIATPTITGGTYAWAPGAFTTDTISVSPVTATTYTVTYTSSCGTATGTGTVNMSAAATVTVNNATACAGSNAQLTATPSVTGGTYAWAPGGFTTDTINVSPATTTVYTVTYSSSCGTPTASGTVTVAPAPALSLTPTQPTCASPNSGSIVAAATGGTGPYQYAINPGISQFTNLAAGSYTVVVSDANGCTASAATTLALPPNPTVNATAGTTCQGFSTGAIAATGTGGTGPYQFALNAGAFQVSDSFTALASGNYTVHVEDANGCTATTNVTVQGVTVALTLAADSENCFGDASAAITATATGGNPAYTYSLNGGAAQASNQFTQLSAGAYTVIATDAGGCTATASTNVFQPTAVVIDSATATAVLCQGQQNGTATVYAGGGTPGYNYNITQGANSFNSASGVFTGLGAGAYSVKVTDSKGCSVTGAVTVPNAIPDQFTVTTQPTSCYGPAYTDGSLTITALTGAGAPFTYAIDSGAFTPANQFNNLAFGTYYPEVMNNNNCLSVLPPAIVAQPAQATLNIYPTDTTLQLGQSVTLTTDFGPYPVSSVVSYIWTPSEYLSCVTCANPIVTPYTPEMTYQLAITYNGHCEVDASVVVHMNDNPDIFIPNVFTPNGDGNNDIFYVYGANVKVFNIKVFNRWGEKVFESNDQQTGWDGRYKGKMQDPAVYVYEASLVLLDNTTYHKRGSVTLVR